MKTKFIFALVLSSGLSLSVVTSAAAPSKMILISDIDDTIKDTQVKPVDLSIAAAASQYWHLMTSILSANNSFIGIPAVYTALAANGFDIHYVTGGIEFFGDLPESFLQSSGFPQGHLWLRPDLSVPTENFKILQIKKIMLSNPTAQFILVGDNGEKDVSVYKKLYADPRFKTQIRQVFIHDLYPKKIGESLSSEQRPFVTAADLSVQLLEIEALTEGQTYQVLQTVDQGLNSQFQDIQRRTFPSTGSLDYNDLRKLQHSEGQIQNPTLRSLFRKIIKQLWLAEPI